MLYKKTDDTVLKLLEKISCGSMSIELHDNRTFEFCAPKKGPAAQLRINSPDVLWNMAVAGDAAFARDYRAGK